MSELKTYQADNPSFEVPKYKSVLLKEERNILEKMQGKPDKPPPSAYLLFSSVMLKNPNLRKLTPKERMQETARLWKNVPKVEKDGYAEKVKHLANIYKLEYASYLESLPEDKREEEMANSLPKRKRKPADNGSTTPAKKVKVDVKNKTQAKPIKTLGEILKRAPQPPPKDAYALFCQDYKDYPEKEIKKSWDALLEAPRAKLGHRVEKLKQNYIVNYRKFLENLAPEELKMYSTHKSSNHTKNDVKLSESESDDNDEEEGDEEEEEEEEECDDDEEEEEAVKEEHLVGEKENGDEAIKKENAVDEKMNEEATRKEDSSEGSDDEEEGKDGEKSSSSSSSSESSSDEEGEGSSSSSSSSSSNEDDGDAF